MDCIAARFWLLLVAVLYATTGQCVHILGLPSIAISHGAVLAKLGKELAQRGYKYTLALPKWEEEYLTPSTSIENYSVRFYDTKYNEADVEELFTNMIIDEMVEFETLTTIWATSCEDLLKNKSYFQELGEVDVMICDIPAVCCAIVADMLNITTRVDISTMGFNDPLLSFYHVFPSPVAYVPQLLMPFPRKMSLLDRTKNAMLYLAGYAVHHIYFIGPYRALKNKYVKNSKYEDIESLVRSTGMFLFQVDFALTTPRPLPPFIKVVGTIIVEQSKSLPKNFIAAMQSHSDVIVVSMGTVITHFDDFIIETMAAAFAKLPAIVIWKHRGKKPSDLGNNTFIYPWIPQNDLLGHPNVSLFVSHCGMNGMLEAAYHGVPVVAVPIFADQFVNAESLKFTGMAEVVRFKTLNTKDLIVAILKVLNDKSYRENAERLSKRMQLPGCGKPGSPSAGCVKLAADWVEYGIRNEGALHFRTEMDNLSFLQLYLIDVGIFVASVAGAVVFGLIFTCKIILKACKRKAKRD